MAAAQIAGLLILSPHTVRTHVRNARRRVGVSSRREALDVLEAIDTGLGGRPAPAARAFTPHDPARRPEDQPRRRVAANHRAVRLNVWSTHGEIVQC
jgi:hypothetical protein